MRSGRKGPRSGLRLERGWLLGLFAVHSFWFLARCSALEKGRDRGTVPSPVIIEDKAQSWKWTPSLLAGAADTVLCRGGSLLEVNDSPLSVHEWE
ncbi:hypothetical protein L5D93_19355 [Paenibacillus thiaminolyticus]|nr:hypothetical protein [Paenibacillus thiaminolyticus]